MLLIGTFEEILIRFTFDLLGCSNEFHQDSLPVVRPLRESSASSAGFSKFGMLAEIRICLT